MTAHQPAKIFSILRQVLVMSHNQNFIAGIPVYWIFAESKTLEQEAR